MKALKLLWKTIRQLSGDDAYERYQAHHAAHHSGQPALSRTDFFKQWQEAKWKGIKRCC